MPPNISSKPSKPSKVTPREARRVRRDWRRTIKHPAVWLGLLGACLLGAFSYLVGCSGWDPNQPFHRDSPVVDRALELYDSGQYKTAEEILEDYLGTGPCKDGLLGFPPTARVSINGS